MSVVNYRARDAGTNPPSVRLSARFAQSATAPESGTRFAMVAAATDDHLVRNVEFYINGQLAAVDGNYLFDVELRAPVLTPTLKQFTVRARAFDTAGNSAWSDPLTIDLSKDSTPPSLIEFQPTSEERFPIGGLVQVSARFDEPIAPATLTAAFNLIHTGADGTAGTSDDIPVP